jgi:hypothetical protein
MYNFSRPIFFWASLSIYRWYKPISLGILFWEVSLITWSEQRDMCQNGWGTQCRFHTVPNMFSLLLHNYSQSINPEGISFVNFIFHRPSWSFIADIYSLLFWFWWTSSEDRNYLSATDKYELIKIRQWIKLWNLKKLRTKWVNNEIHI